MRHRVGKVLDGAMALGPLFWFTLSYLSLFAFAAVFLWGHTSPKNDWDDACRAAGEIYDPEARVSWSQPIFPISYPCNSDYDLVAWWVNPTVALFALGCLVGVVGWLYTTGRWTYRTIQQHRRQRATDAPS